MTALFAPNETVLQWDEMIVQNPDGGNVFASREVAETKRRNGWLPRYATFDEMPVTILEKHVPLLGKYWYLPKGPGETSISALKVLLPEIQRFATENGVFAVKIEPEIPESEETHPELAALGLVKTSPVQPNVSTVIIDLSSSLEEVMKNFNQKGRHAVRRAERDGVVARAVELTDENMKTMYDLLVDTAAGRFESSVRDLEYYKTFWKAFAESGHGQLFFAYFEDKVVAGAYAMYLGQKGLYKDGASIRERTAYGASHLLQWVIMTWMSERGVTSYDLCGAPHSSRINDESHPFYGVGRFKTSFNKHVTDYVGCYDLPVKPLQYKLWSKIGQRLVISLTWRLTHAQWF